MERDRRLSIETRYKVWRVGRSTMTSRSLAELSGGLSRREDNLQDALIIVGRPEAIRAWAKRRASDHTYKS